MDANISEVGIQSPNYMAQQPRKPRILSSLPWKHQVWHQWILSSC